MQKIRDFMNNNEADRGKAFVTAVAGCIFQAVVLGISNSFPSMQGQMLSDEDFESTSSKQLITLAFAFSTGLAPFFGVFSGRLTNVIGPRFTTFISVGACTTALLGASFGAKDFGTVVGVYGVFMGVTQGFALAPGATTVSTWFVNRKPVGMGILFASGGVGSLIVPPIVGALLDGGYDWRQTMQIICSFNIVAFLCCCLLSLRDSSGDEDTTVRGSPVGGGEVAEHEIQVAAEHIKDKTAFEEIEHDWNLHNDEASPEQYLFRIILTKSFIALFLVMGFFSIAFFGYLFIAVPYPLTMGSNGTKYADAEPINIKDASNLFIAYGAMTAVGGPGAGYIAHLTTDRYAFSAFMCLLGVTLGCTALCREYYSFVLIMLIQGWCGGAFWGIFPSFVGRRFYGPNLGLTMGLVFVAGAAGGFGGPFAATDMVEAQSDSDYTPVLGFFAACAIAAGLIILFTMEDRMGVPVLGEGERQKLAALHKKELEAAPSAVVTNNEPTN